MGILSWLSGGTNDDSNEATLTNEYAAMFKAMGLEDPRAKAVEFIKKAKEEVVRRASTGEWSYTADAILGSSDARLIAFRQERRRDGVRDEDMRWWWSLSPLDRVLLEKADEMNRLSLFWSLTSKGMPPDEASRQVFKFHPRRPKPR